MAKERNSQFWEYREIKGRSIPVLKPSEIFRPRDFRGPFPGTEGYENWIVLKWQAEIPSQGKKPRGADYLLSELVEKKGNWFMMVDEGPDGEEVYRPMRNLPTHEYMSPSGDLTQIYIWGGGEKEGSRLLTFDEVYGSKITMQAPKAQTGKRESRFFQGYQHAALVPNEKIFEFSEDTALRGREYTVDYYDGANFISESGARAVFGRLNLEQGAKQLHPKTVDEFIRAGRFSGTVQSAEGQYKGHFFILPDEEFKKRFGREGWIAAPAGSLKKEFGYNWREGYSYVALEHPIRSHSHGLIDIQSWTNSYRQMFSMDQALGWLHESHQRVIDAIRRDDVSEIMGWIFSDVEDEVAFEKRRTLPLYDYLMSGGKLSQSPFFTEQFLELYQERIQNRIDRHKLRIPITGLGSAYLASATVGGLNLKPGEAYWDYERGSVFVSDADIEEWRKALKVMGGGDQDDRVNVLVNTKGEIYMSRSPNAQGEFIIRNLVNAQDLKQYGVKLIDVDFRKALEGKITTFDEKQYQYPDALPSEGQREYASYADFIRQNARRVWRHVAAVGTYINALTGLHMFYGREPRIQAAPSEVVIDTAQKLGGEGLEEVYKWIKSETAKIKDKPLAEEIQRRLRLSDGVTAHGHWYDELQAGFEREYEFLQAEKEELMKRGSIPTAILEAAQGRELGDKLRQAWNKSFAYDAAHNQKPSYKRAALAVERALLSLPEDQRDQAIYQAIANRNYGEGASDEFLMNKVMYPYTVEALRKIGVLGTPSIVEVEDAPKMQVKEGEVTATGVTRTLQTSYAWGVEAERLYAEENEGASLDEAPDEVRKGYRARGREMVARRAREYEGRSVYTQMSESGYLYLIDLETGERISSVDKRQAREFETMTSARVARATPTKGGELILSLEDVQFADLAEPDERNRQLERQVSWNYIEAARMGVPAEDLTGVVRSTYEYFLQNMPPEKDAVQLKNERALNDLLRFSLDVAFRKETMEGLTEQNRAIVEWMVDKLGGLRPPAPSFAMNYAYDRGGAWAARWAPGEGPATTLEAIKAGLRTSTIRWNKEDIQKIQGLKVGDIIDVTSGDETVKVRVTGEGRMFDPVKATAEDWEALSQSEGWTVDWLKERFREEWRKGRKTAWTFTYEPISDVRKPQRDTSSPFKVFISGSRNATEAMLARARNVVGQLAERIKSGRAYQILVGDAPGIDTAVIEEADRLEVPVTVTGAKGELRHQSAQGDNQARNISYTGRDRLLTEMADAGIVIWDEESLDTQANIQRFQREGKPIVVYGKAGERIEPTPTSQRAQTPAPAPQGLGMGVGNIGGIRHLDMGIGAGDPEAGAVRNRLTQEDLERFYESHGYVYDPNLDPWDDPLINELGYDPRLAAMNGEDIFAGSGDEVPPPPEPPDDLPPISPDPDLDSEDAYQGPTQRTFASLKNPPRPEILNQIQPLSQRAAHFLFSAQTGYGKTSVLQTAFIESINRAGGGVGILVSPFRKLNEQLERSFQEAITPDDIDLPEDQRAQRNAYFLPGYPGEGADPELLKEWGEAHYSFYRDLGVAFDDDGRPIIWSAGPVITGKGRLRWRDGKLEWHGAPIAITLSNEKMAALPGSQLGRVLRWLSENNLVPFVGIDEGHSLTDPTRYMGRYVIDAIRNVASEAQRAVVSGSLTPDQVESIRAMMEIEPENVIKVPRQWHDRIHWSAHRAMNKEAAEVQARALARAGNQPAMMFVSYIDQMEAYKKSIGEAGRSPFLYHADPSRPLSPEEQAYATEKLINKGMEEGDVGILTGAVGTGINRPEVGYVGVQNPYDMSDLMQKAGRVRSPMDDQPDRFVAISGDPVTYQRRADELSQTGLALQDLGFLGQIFTKIRQGDYSRNWQVAKQQIDAVVEEELVARGLNKYSASKVTGYFQEAGLINMTQVAEGDKSYFGFQFADISTPTEVAAHLADPETRVRASREVDPQTGKPKEVSVKERIRLDFEYLSNEQRALGRLIELSTTPGLTEEEGGQIIKRGIEAYESQGLEGLQNLVDFEIPKELAQKFTTAVAQATQSLEQVAVAGGDISQAMQQFGEAMSNAAKVIVDNPTTAQTASEMMASLSRSTADSPYRSTIYEAVSQTLRSIRSGGGGYGGGDGDSGGIPPAGSFDPDRPRTPSRRVGGALYSIYMASRFWRMLAGDIPQDIAQYQEIRSRLDPLEFYGDQEAMALSPVAQARGRSSLTRYLMGQAAYEVYGPLDGLSYEIAQRPLAARALQAGKISLAIAAAGHVLSSQQLASVLGLPALGPAAGTIGIGAALLNLGYWGFREIQLYQEQQAKAWTALTGSPLTMREWMEQEGFTHADMARMSSGSGDGLPGPALWLWMQKPMTKEEKEAARQLMGDSLDTIAKKVVEAADLSVGYEDLIPVVGEFRKLAGGKILEGDRYYEALVELTRTAATEGADPSSLLQEAIGFASVRNLPDTPEYFNAIRAYVGMNRQARVRASERQSRIASFAGQFQGFMTGREAMDYVERYGIDTQPEASARLGLFQAFTQVGHDLNQIVGYSIESAGEPWTGAGSAVYAIRLRDQLEEFARTHTPQQAMYAAQLVSQWGDFGLSAQQSLALMSGITTQAQVQSVSTFLNLGEQFGFTSQMDAITLTNAALNMTPFAASAIAPVLQMSGIAGYNVPELAQRLSHLNPQQAWMFGRMAQGDLSAWSHWARQSNDPAYQFLGIDGRPIYHTNGQAFVEMLAAQARDGIAQAGVLNALQRVLGLTGIPTVNQIAQAMGASTNPYMQAFLQDDIYAAQRQYAADMYGIQMAQVALQLRGIALQERYLWGSGSPTSPSTNSMWGLQDQLRALQHRSTMTDFAVSRERAELQNQYAIAQEGIQWQRLQLQYGMAERQESISRQRHELQVEYQRWTREFDYAGALMQREWTREDWEYSEQLRNLQYQWESEDIAEAIRYSSGRERRQLMRQQERMAVMRNLEDEKIETDQERQEKIWAREDERFEKQKVHQEALIALDEEQFELNKSQREALYTLDVKQFELQRSHREQMFDLEIKELERKKKEYLEQKEIQDQMIKLEREFQYEQLELQKQAAQLQAAAAAAAYQYSEAQSMINELYAASSGSFKEMVENDPSDIIKKLEELAVTLHSVDSSRIIAAKNYTDAISDLASSLATNRDAKGVAEAMGSMASALSGLTTDRLNAIRDMAYALRNVDPVKIKAVTDMIIMVMNMQA